MGRSRSGLTTKIHALVDANGMPIALKRNRSIEAACREVR